MLGTGPSRGNNTNDYKDQAEAEDGNDQTSDGDSSSIISRSTSKITPAFMSAIGTITVIIMYTFHASSSIRIAGRKITSTIVIIQAARSADSTLDGADVQARLNSSPVIMRAVSVVSALHTAALLDVTVGDAGVLAVLIKGTVVYTQTNFGIATLLAGTDSAGGTVLGSTGVSRGTAVVTLSVGTTVGERRAAVAVRGARTADTVALADGLSRDLSSIKTTAVVVTLASTAGTISLTVLSRGAVRVGGTGALADSRRNIAKTLVGAFTTINIAVNIGGAGNTETALHAVVTLSSSAIRISVASVNTKTRGKVTVRLSLSLSSIKRTTG